MASANKVLKQFGLNLKQARLAKKLSQEQLAFEIGFDRTYISMLERGLRNPPLTTIKHLSHILGISVSSLTHQL